MHSIVSSLAVNTLRFLGAEMVEAANSGHPGIALGAAPMALALWGQMKFSPKNPGWRNRDRFVLSAGHGSPLLYSLMHLFGCGVSLDDVKKFRQLGSVTPGHPEYGVTAGVDMTTGPLGQGIANAVGFAIAETQMAARFNKPEFELFGHYTYALCGDGCLEEGVSYEAASLAGTLGLGRLIVLYDSNDITIEGDISATFTEDIGARFHSANWHYQRVDDGNDTRAVHRAIQAAKRETAKPSLIEVKTVIGYGAPKAGTADVHGMALGRDAIEAAKKNLRWRYDEPFFVPDEVRRAAEAWQEEALRGEEEWNALYCAYKKAYPGALEEWERAEVSYADFSEILESPEWAGEMPTRQASGALLNVAAKKAPCLIGGSADLAPSCMTTMRGRGSYGRDNRTGTNIHFGVREHAMGAIANGLAAYGGFRPYVSGFFVFADYMKPAMRLSALMRLPVVYIFTHDTIGVGEDGPTHQPVEQLALLRSIPGFTVFRPCDIREAAAAWESALGSDGPTAIVLTRQKTPPIDGTGEGAKRGAYALPRGGSVNPGTGEPDVILIACGSEVDLAARAQDMLFGDAIYARVVSMPSMEAFEAQPAEYRESVLPRGCRARLAIEAAATFGWHKYTGLDGDVVGMDAFGLSAPAGELFNHFGFTAKAVAERARLVYEKNN